MQPEATVFEPLLAIAFILGTAIVWSLSDHIEQKSALALAGYAAFDPKRPKTGFC
jgi:hypothetical protein